MMCLLSLLDRAPPNRDMSDFAPLPSREAFVVGRSSVFLEALPLHSRAPLLRAPASPCVRVAVSGHTRLPVACVFCAQGSLSPWTRGWHRESRAPTPVLPRWLHTRGFPLASKPCAQRGTRVAILRARLPSLRGLLPLTACHTVAGEATSVTWGSFLPVVRPRQDTVDRAQDGSSLSPDEEAFPAMIHCSLLILA